MVFILIDGYNVTGVLHGDMDAERERLIAALAEYRKRKGHDITVVFDGWKDGGGRESTQVSGGVKVVYTALGEKADAFIKKAITGDRQWVVVSSDREIQSHAWAMNAVPLDSDVFLRILERGETGADYFDDEEDEDEYDHQPRKGNPRKLSKKEKAVRRVMGKL